ncbi:MAG: hypothetical protein QG663_57 [Thermodesulfobacteriota bacterium]|nr:hypothetical protein [Thermodesulfobacteriota bacterium]
MVNRPHVLLKLIVLSILWIPSIAASEVVALELSCPSCGYRHRFVQGADGIDQSHNVQNIIVVCERTRQIRNIKIPIDPGSETPDEPLVARRSGYGKSDLLGIQLPRFIVPGNTCPLFPINAYLEANVCPIDGNSGFSFAVIGQY